MGQSGSSSAAVDEIPTPRKTVSRYVATFRKLHGELSCPDETGDPASDDLLRVRLCSFVAADRDPCVSLQTRFQQHFGGPCLELGHLLYRQMFGHVTTSVSVETFVAAASRLELVCTRGSREDAGSLVFSIFGEGADTLTEKGEGDVSSSLSSSEDFSFLSALTDLVHTSAILALVLGSDLHDNQSDIPRDHALISALLHSAV